MLISTNDSVSVQVRRVELDHVQDELEEDLGDLVVSHSGLRADVVDVREEPLEEWPDLCLKVCHLLALGGQRFQQV